MVDESEPKLIKAARYRNLCPKMVQLATRSSELKAAYEFVNETVDYMFQKVATMFLNEEESVEVGGGELDLSDPNFSQAKGLKKKDGLRRGRRRYKSWHEDMGRRKKNVSQPSRLSQVLSLLNLMN